MTPTVQGPNHRTAGEVPKQPVFLPLDQQADTEVSSLGCEVSIPPQEVFLREVFLDPFIV